MVGFALRHAQRLVPALKPTGQPVRLSTNPTAPPPTVPLMQDGKASGERCKPSSLLGNLCVDMPGMKGCEAWNGMCGGGSKVRWGACFVAKQAQQGGLWAASARTVLWCVPHAVFKQRVAICKQQLTEHPLHVGGARLTACP